MHDETSHIFGTGGEHPAGEYTLRDSTGRVVASGSLDQVTRYLKHHVGDGDYSVEGPDPIS